LHEFISSCTRTKVDTGATLSGKILIGMWFDFTLTGMGYEGWGIMTNGISIMVSSLV
jgi:hypothetical protein